jgi:hypothetical protein
MKYNRARKKRQVNAQFQTMPYFVSYKMPQTQPVFRSKGEHERNGKSMPSFNHAIFCVIQDATDTARFFVLSFVSKETEKRPQTF